MDDWIKKKNNFLIVKICLNNELIIELNNYMVLTHLLLFFLSSISLLAPIKRN